MSCTVYVVESSYRDRCGLRKIWFYVLPKKKNKTDDEIPIRKISKIKMYCLENMKKIITEKNKICFDKKNTTKKYGLKKKS